MTVYLDMIFAVNIIIDYLILVLVRKDLFPQTNIRRIFAGALLSSVTYIIWYLLKICYFQCRTATAYLLFLFFLPFILIGIILMWIFRIRSFSLFVKTIGVTIGYTFLFGGCGYFFYKKICNLDFSQFRWQSVFLCTMIFFTGIMLQWKKIKRESEKVTNNLYEVELRRREKTVYCQGIYDSGNLLVSKITGRGICVMSLQNVMALLDDQEKELLSVFKEKNNFPWEMMAEKIKFGLYPICYSSVGNENAYMPGIIADQIIVTKKGEVLADYRGMIGISAKSISKKKEFSILLPADIFME